MGFYNFVPDVMKELQIPDAGELLTHDGRNIASVIARMEREAASEKVRLEQYLEKIVAGVTGVTRQELGSYETLTFTQRLDDANGSCKFQAASMSDGTLRALGILAAVAQIRSAGKYSSLVGIERDPLYILPPHTPSGMR